MSDSRYEIYKSSASLVSYAEGIRRSFGPPGSKKISKMVLKTNNYGVFQS